MSSFAVDAETTMATIDTAPTRANVFVYRCVPNAPTAQNGEKFGAMPAPFKMSGATPA